MPLFERLQLRDHAELTQDPDLVHEIVPTSVKFVGKAIIAK